MVVARCVLNLSIRLTSPTARQTGRAIGAVLGFLICVASAPDVADAHAIIVSARPGVNSTVPPGDLELRLEFNSRIDAQRSRLRLRGPDGTETPVALAAQSSPNVVAGHASVMTVGQWRLDWQVLSLDGHITRGEIGFSVQPLPSKP
jgi:methionine-rich copper-binding protein CopC